MDQGKQKWKETLICSKYYLNLCSCHRTLHCLFFSSWHASRVEVYLDGTERSYAGSLRVLRMSDGSRTVIITHVTQIGHAHWSGTAKPRVRSRQVYGKSTWLNKAYKGPYGRWTVFSLRPHRKWPATRQYNVTLTGCPSGHDRLSHNDHLNA